MSRWKFPVPYAPAASESGSYRYRKREKCNPFRPSCKRNSNRFNLPSPKFMPNFKVPGCCIFSSNLPGLSLILFVFSPCMQSVLPRHNLWKRKRGGIWFLPFFPLFATVISLLRFPPSLRTPSANPRGCGPSRGHPYRQVSGDRR